MLMTFFLRSDRSRSPVSDDDSSKKKKAGAGAGAGAKKDDKGSAKKRGDDELVRFSARLRVFRLHLKFSARLLRYSLPLSVCCSVTDLALTCFSLTRISISTIAHRKSSRPLPPLRPLRAKRNLRPNLLPLLVCSDCSVNLSVMRSCCSSFVRPS